MDKYYDVDMTGIERQKMIDQLTKEIDDELAKVLFNKSHKIIYRKGYEKQKKISK